MKKLFAVLLVLGCAALIPTWAMASACPDADPNTQDFCLDQPNNDALNVGDIVLHVTYNAGTNELKVHVNSFGAGITIKGIDQITLNNNDGVNYFTGGTFPGDWNDGAASPDGFGNNPNFDSEAKSPGGTDLAGGIGELTFTLSGDPTFTQVVIHLRYDTPNSTNCSLFISNIARPGGPSPANRDECGTTEIPEPGSLALLGTGLFSAVGVLRRKLLKK